MNKPIYHVTVIYKDPEKKGEVLFLSKQEAIQQFGCISNLFEFKNLLSASIVDQDRSIFIRPVRQENTND